MSNERAKNIKLLLFDVDGVLTDGKIWIFPLRRRAFGKLLRKKALKN